MSLVREMNAEKGNWRIRKDQIYGAGSGEWKQRQRQIYANIALKVPQSFMLTEKLKPKEQTKYRPSKTFLIHTGWKNYVLLHQSFCVSLSTSIK